MSGGDNVRFNWTADKIIWHSRASLWSENNRNQLLAQAVLEELCDSPRIIDLGCGLGYMDFELAKSATLVHGVDVSERAILHMKSEIDAQNIPNVEAKCADFHDLILPKTPYDGVVQCLVGYQGDFLGPALRQCGGKILYIARSQKRRCFSAGGEHRGRSFDGEIREYLQKSDLNFQEKKISAAFGQPLTDLEDAVRFLRSYDDISTETQIQSAIDARLETRDDAIFPYFLPNTREYVMFVISVNSAGESI